MYLITPEPRTLMKWGDPSGGITNTLCVSGNHIRWRLLYFDDKIYTSTVLSSIFMMVVSYTLELAAETDLHTVATPLGIAYTEWVMGPTKG